MEKLVPQSWPTNVLGAEGRSSTEEISKTISFWYFVIINDQRFDGSAWTCKVLHTKWVRTSLARLYAMRLSSIHSDHILKICKLLKIWQPYCYEYSEMIVCTHVCRSSCFPAVWILLNYVSYVAAGVMLRLWLCSEQCSGSRWDCEGGSLPLWILDMPQTNVLDMAHRLFIGFDSSWLCQVVVFVQPWSV